LNIFNIVTSHSAIQNCSTIMVKFYEKLWLLKKITNYWHLNFLLLIAPRRGWHLFWVFLSADLYQFCMFWGEKITLISFAQKLYLKWSSIQDSCHFELLTPSKHLSSPKIFVGVSVSRSSVFCVVFCRFFVCLFFFGQVRFCHHLTLVVIV
jgi:hypothetical protein